MNSHNRPHALRHRLLAIGVAAAMTASAATADETTDSLATPDGSAGLTVAIDAETGELRRPSAAEAAKLSAAMRKLTARNPELAVEQPVEYRADGSRSKRLDASHLNYSIAHRHADGSLDSQCAAGLQHAAAALVHPTVAREEQ